MKSSTRKPGFFAMCLYCKKIERKKKMQEKHWICDECAAAQTPKKKEVMPWPV